MVWARQQRTVTGSGERFPTEWALDRGDEQDAEGRRPEEAGLEARVPASSIEEMRLAALRWQ